MKELSPADPNFQRRPTADGFDTLYSAAYGQTFHSRYGALFESEHVFLKGAGVQQRLAERRPTRILEVGFGTGLNFWVTVQAGRAAETSLEYVALEKHLPPTEILAHLNHGALLAEVEALRRTFLAWRDNLPESLPAAPLSWPVDDNIRLTLILGDATTVDIPRLAYHAIYHDAFSPAANPELWTQTFFARLYDRLTPGGVLASYSVKGDVRRNLQAAGFQVEKRPGPPGKREIVAAIREDGGD